MCEHSTLFQIECLKVINIAARKMAAFAVSNVFQESLYCHIIIEIVATLFRSPVINCKVTLNSPGLTEFIPHSACTYLHLRLRALRLLN
jgi:hypothetical protein